MGKLVSLSSFPLSIRCLHYAYLVGYGVVLYHSTPYRLLSNLYTLYLRSPGPLSNGMSLPQ